MTLAASGEIALGGSTSTRSVNLELNYAATAVISMNDTAVRTLFGISSGQISLANGYGKSNLVRGNTIYATAGTYTFVVPSSGVASISLVAIGGGGGVGAGAGVLYGGGGGGLAYSNNISVTGGQSITVIVGTNGGYLTDGGDSSVGPYVTAGGGKTHRTGSLVHTGGVGTASASYGTSRAGNTGGAGGAGTSGGGANYPGGGGAAGYSGNGGAGGDYNTAGTAGSGGAAAGVGAHSHMAPPAAVVG